MNEQALQTLYNLAQQNGYTDSYAQFKALMASNTEAVSSMYAIAQQNGYTDSADQFNTLVGFDSGAPTQTTPEPELSNREIALAGIDAEHQEWLEANGFAGYNVNERGDIVDPNGNIVSIKHWDQEQFAEPEQTSSLYVTPPSIPGLETLPQEGQPEVQEDGTMPILGGGSRTSPGDVLSFEDAELLDERFQNYRSRRNLISHAADGLEEIEQDPIQGRIHNNISEQSSFYNENFDVDIPIEEVEGEDMNFTMGDEQWKYIGGNAQSLQLVKKLVNGEWVDYLGPDVIMTKTEAIAKDIRLGDLINILNERDSIKQEQENRAKASGAENVGQVTKEDFQKKENTALRDLMNRKDEFLRMGITIEDRDWEAGVGELTFINTNIPEGEEDRLFKIDAGLFASNSKKTIDNLNQWLKNSAYDHETALKGSLAMSVATQKQQEENLKEAVEYTNEFEKRKNQVHDREAENRLKNRIMIHACTMAGFDPEDPVQDFKIAIERGMRSEDPRYKKVIASIKEAYSSRFFTIEIDGNEYTAEQLGFDFLTITKDWGKVATTDIEGQQELNRRIKAGLPTKDTYISGIETGYEATKRFFGEGENIEFNKLVEREIEDIAKDQYIDQLDQAIKNAAPESGEGSQAEADRLGIQGPGLPPNVVREIMRSENPSALIMSKYPEYTDLLQDLPSFNDIKQGITASHEDVRRVLTCQKKRELDIEDGTDNIMASVNASSSAWFQEEEFQKELDDESKVRFNELSPKYKETIRAFKGQRDKWRLVEML